MDGVVARLHAADVVTKHFLALCGAVLEGHQGDQLGAGRAMPQEVDQSDGSQRRQEKGDHSSAQLGTREVTEVSNVLDIQKTLRNFRTKRYHIKITCVKIYTINEFCYNVV